MFEATYNLTFESISALVMNSNAALLGEKPDKGRDPAEWEREHFREKAYADAESKLVIPARCIKKALIEGCKFYPHKPKGVSFKSYGPFIQAATIVAGDALLYTDEAKECRATLSNLRPYTMVVNLDPSKGPKGPRGPRTRPALAPPWFATCSLTVFDAIITKDVLDDLARIAGTQVGLLDGRTIDMGRCLIGVTLAAKKKAA
jgi:hypothetical protein